MKFFDNIKDNVKTSLAIFGFFTTILGFVIAQYITITTLPTDVKKLETTINKLDDRIYDLQLFVMNEKQKRKSKLNAKGTEE